MTASRNLSGLHIVATVFPVDIANDIRYDFAMVKSSIEIYPLSFRTAFNPDASQFFLPPATGCPADSIEIETIAGRFLFQVETGIFRADNG